MEEQAFPISFGEWVRQRRKTLDLTQAELAQRAGCSVFALRKIESGERRPSRQLAGLLADALEISPTDQPAFHQAARSYQAPAGLPTGPPHPPPRPAPPPTPHLPVPITPLLGRESELAAMAHLFADPQCRLLTLTGMGGIGKTRLAIEFGACRQALFAGGVRYVPLAGLAAPELIVPAIAEAFGFTFSGPVDPKEQLIRHLRGAIRQPTLLILDNLEHLLAPTAGAAELVSELLGRLPPLRILVTSRERLNLHGEWMYELHGLSTPPSPYFDDVTDYSAAELFVQSARRGNMAFALSEEDRPALVQICQLLEGVPLAVELAAAWSPVLSCAEIAREVATNIDFLTATTRDLPERHRSLRATFNHSWRLLPEEERAALCALSVFHGGFDRVAAEQVAGATLPLLASLAAKSLIRRGEDNRYDLHEVIRQFALLALQEYPPRFEAIRDQHCQHYLRRVASQERALKSEAQQEALQQLLQDADNIRAAWLWGIEREKVAALGAAVRGLGWMFEVAGLLHEGIETLEPLARALRAKSDNGDSQRLLGRTLTQQGLLYFRSGTFDRAQSLLKESLAILRPLGEPWLLIDSLVYLGIIRYLNNDVEWATALLAEAVASARGGQDEWFVAFATLGLGHLIGLRGEYTAAREKEEAALALWRRLGDPHAIAMGLNYLTPTLVQLGLLEVAETYLWESLELSRRTRNRWGLGTAYRFMGLVKIAQGEYDTAEAMLRQGLETFGDYIIGWDIACSYVYLGELMLRRDQPTAAAENYTTGLRLARDIQSPPLMLDALVGLAELAGQTGNGVQALELAEMVAHHPVASRAVQLRAVQVAACAGNGLDEEVRASVKQSARLSRLDDVVDALIAH